MEDKKRLRYWFEKDAAEAGPADKKPKHEIDPDLREAHAKMVRPEFDHTLHPGRDYRKLPCYYRGVCLEKRDDWDKFSWVQWDVDVTYKDPVLCRVCGWTPDMQTQSGYTPRIGIMQAERHNTGYWTIGEHFILRDEPKWPNHNDYITQKFLREQPNNTIPLVTMLALDKPDDKFRLTLMSRAEGEPLACLWPNLTAEEKAGYSTQMITIMKEMRSHTRDSIQKADGELPWSRAVIHPPTGLHLQKSGVLNL